MKPEATTPTNMTRREFLATSAATVVSVSMRDTRGENESGKTVALRDTIAPTIGLANTLTLSGSDWFIHEGSAKWGANSEMDGADVSDNCWIPARVPGNIQADLERSHRLNPLWYGAGDPRLVDVAQKDWWYRKDFLLPEAFREKRLTLIFDGVDFQFEAWLNGRPLGIRAGQFRRLAFDVSNAAKPGEKNRLAVRITKMPHEVVHCLKASDGALSGLKSPNWFITCYIHTRQVLQGLKSVSNFGYDWGVNIYTLGIWRDVWLVATGSTRIEWVQINTELSDQNRRATVKSRLELDTQEPLRVRASFRVRGQGIDTNVAAEKFLKEGKNAIDAQIVLDQPELWWPNGHGEQPLYELEVRLEDTDSGLTLDSTKTRFGVRGVHWEQTEGAPPNFINPYRLIVNGRPIRMMGSDMTSPDLLFGRNWERWPRLVDLAKTAGINTLRMHGAGVTLPPGFYEATDELGIMLSNEFPLANSWPETDPVFLSNLEATTLDIVKQLRNHSSIIEWVGGNEMPWEQGTNNPALHVLERVCAENDTRIFRATDPMQGSKHSPWLYNPRTHYEHYNQVLESLFILHPDFGVNTMNAMRYGEFGTQTPTNLEVFQREIPPSSQVASE